MRSAHPLMNLGIFRVLELKKKRKYFITWWLPKFPQKIFESYLHKQISCLFCTFHDLKSINKRNDNMNLVGPCTYIMIIGDTFHKCNITVSSSCLFIFQSFVWSCLTTRYCPRSSYIDNVFVFCNLISISESYQLIFSLSISFKTGFPT